MLLALDERADPRPDVVNPAIVGWNQKSLVDVGAHPATGERGLGDDIEAGSDLVAVHRELRRRDRRYDPVLGSATKTASQVICGEAGLEAHLDAGAVGGEGHRVAVMAHQRVNIGLRGRDPLVVSPEGRTQIRSMMVPVDSAPPAHIVIRAVL